MTAENVEVSFEYRMLGKRGHIQMIAHLPGATFTDKLDVTDAEGRERFVKKLLAKYGGLDRDEVERELDRIAGEVADAAMRKGGDGDDGESDTLDKEDSELLVDIARNKEDVELFHDGNGRDAEAYATIKIGRHTETWPVRSSGFSHWIRHEFYKLCKRTPGSQAFNDAIRLIASIAIFDGEQRRVFVRLAEHGDSIYLDLADDRWQVVRITGGCWEVIENSGCPVRFIRRRGMRALPVPVRGGHINDLRPFVNCPTEELWTLYAGSLVSLFRPRGPYAGLAWTGEQGSAKSSAVKKTRSLIDPNTALVRRLPRDDRDLMIGAKNSFVQAFDNISTIPPSISDALCSLMTGGGFGTRELYSDDEEIIIDVARPVFLNGIADVATRADLLDRCVLLNLPPIAETERREERELDAAFGLAHPRILGALLDAVSTAIRRYPSITLKRKPRMIDFARWCTAAEASFGWPDGTFVDAYMRNRSDAVLIAIEASAIGSPVLAFMDGRESWTGTAAELLGLLEEGFADQKRRDRRDWPGTPKGFSDALRRIAPPLRTLGLDAVFGERAAGGNRERLITLRTIQRPTDEPSSSSDDSGELEMGPAGDSATGPAAGDPELPDADTRDDWDAWDCRVPTSDVAERETDTCSGCPDATPPLQEVGTQPSQASQPSLPSDCPGQGLPEPCCLCCGMRHWHRRPSGPLVCGGCHPPSIDPSEVVWVEDEIASDGGGT